MPHVPLCTRRALLAVVVLLAGAIGPAWAQPVRVTGAWARATAPGQDTGVAYLSMTSPVADRLVGVSSPDAGMAMLHVTADSGGMSGMRDLDGVAVPAGETVRLAPHGMHVMLMGLKHGLAAGGVVELDLDFAKAGIVHVRVPVRPIGASGPPG